jgi:hypothetical protein
MGTRVDCHRRSDFCAQTTTSGLAVQAVARQSIDSNSIDNCAIVSVTTPFLTIPKQNLDHATSAAPENLKMESEPL